MVLGLNVNVFRLFISSFIYFIFVSTSISEFRSVLKVEEQNNGGFSPCLLATSETFRQICMRLDHPLAPERTF